MDPEATIENAGQEATPAGKTRKVLSNLKITPQLVKEIRTLNKKTDISREALTLTGKDANFYQGAMNNIAELEIEREEWNGRVVEVNQLAGQQIPQGAMFDTTKGEFYIEE